MNRSRFAWTGVACALVLSGCTSLPLDYIDPPVVAPGPTVGALLAHIRCQLANSFGDPNTGANFKKRDNYLAQITLTLKVQDADGASPSLSFITPYSGAGSPSFTKLLGATLSATGSRTFTTTYITDLKKLPQTCPSADQGIFSLESDLQLKAIVSNGMTANSDSNVDVKPEDKQQQQPLIVEQILDNKKPPTTRPIFRIHPTDSGSSAAGGTKPVPQPSLATFGSQLEFAVVRSVNAGPSWSLKYFKGPSGGSGFLSAGRTTTDTLIVAFSPKSGKASQLVDKIKELDDRIQRNSDQLTGAQRDIRALQQPAGPDVHTMTDFTSRQAQLRNQIAALEQALVADRAKANTYAGELEAAEADSTNIESAVVGAQSLTTTILLQQRDQLSGP